MTDVSVVCELDIAREYGDDGESELQEPEEKGAARPSAMENSDTLVAEDMTDMPRSRCLRFVRDSCTLASTCNISAADMMC